jgi:nucleotidyltransferase/DNA polymerase involved in DNA repair
MKKENAIRELREIPGVGVKIAEDLWAMGIRTPADLKNKNPELLYEQLCSQSGYKVDRCMLYVFRTAVYYTSNIRHNPEKLKWWNWKD